MLRVFAVHRLIVFAILCHKAFCPVNVSVYTGNSSSRYRYDFFFFFLNRHLGAFSLPDANMFS